MLSSDVTIHQQTVQNNNNQRNNRDIKQYNNNWSQYNNILTTIFKKLKVKYLVTNIF